MGRWSGPEPGRVSCRRSPGRISKPSAATTRSRPIPASSAACPARWDPESSRTQIEVDVVVLAPAEPGRPRKILSLGEAKWDRVMDLRHAGRLHRARDLLAVKGFDTRG